MSLTTVFRELWIEPVRAERMAVFRVSIAAVVLLDTLFSLLPDALDWFGTHGAFSPELYASWLTEWMRWSLLPVNASDTTVILFVWTLAACAALVLVGLATRPACFAMWALLLSLHMRNPHILSGGDTLMRCACFYLMFMPAGAAWSLDNLLRRRLGRPVTGLVAPWSLRFAQLQILIVYFATGYEKLRGIKPSESWGEWIDGTAAYKAATYATMARFPGFFASFPEWMFYPASWATLGLETLFVPLVLWKRTRWHALACGFFLHMGIFMTMEVGHFSFTVLSYYWLFVPAAILMDVAGRATGGNERRRYLVFYDGMCPVCKRSKRWLERLDWLGRLEFADIHDRARADTELPAVTYADMLRRMYVKRPDASYFAGFEAFRAMAPMLPLCWPIMPVLWLPGAAMIGKRMYDFIARNRFRYAKCDNEFCSLHLKLLAGKQIDDNIVAQVIELNKRYRSDAPAAQSL